MTWLKLDDGFAEHERIDPLTPLAFRLHVTALCFCSRNLTDGLLRQKDVKVLLVRSGAKTRHVDELVEIGLWVPDGDDHRIRDYLQYNPTADEVKEQRRRAAERMRNVRATRSRERSPERASELHANVRGPHPTPSHTESVEVSKPSFLPRPATDGTEGRNGYDLEKILGDVA